MCNFGKTDIGYSNGVFSGRNFQGISSFFVGYYATLKFFYPNGYTIKRLLGLAIGDYTVKYSITIIFGYLLGISQTTYDNETQYGSCFFCF